MNYTNPIILGDYSDPDAIKYNGYYYMVASSFNHTPGIPVLKSKNLVDWKIIGYVFEHLPFDRFNNKVFHGEGAWAPSIRYHNGKIYVIVPFVDEGVYIYETTDIDNCKFSEPWCLIDRAGIIDPCPIWTNDGKCYLVVGFAKSRIGFNSMLGLYEVSSDLKTNISGDFTIIFDGHNTAPTIEGPKFYYRNNYYYIMAPAGSVKSGWQVALRSKNVYGPYDMKIVMLQNDSKVNGPHQGALVEIKDDQYAFLHFQDLGCYGRVVHLQPARFIDDWPICGLVKDELLGGSPVDNYPYLIDKKSNYKIDISDDFKTDTLSYMWQTPANIDRSWYKLDDGLTLYAKSFNEADKALNKAPNLFLAKLAKPSFKVQTKLDLCLNESDEAGLVYMGKTYTYICVKKLNGINYIQIKQGSYEQDEDIVLESIEYDSNEITLNLKYIEPNKYQLGFNGKYFNDKYIATPGRWIGGKIGIYAKGLSNGNAKFHYFKVK